ncbi:hypothetical protein D1007_09056 [Hordeum vulgare]|nr:hypothetical protein D1007_09056 [Hordeum vulgare]
MIHLAWFLVGFTRISAQERLLGFALGSVTAGQAHRGHRHRQESYYGQPGQGQGQGQGLLPHRPEVRNTRGEGAPRDLLRIALQADPIQRDGPILFGVGVQGAYGELTRLAFYSKVAGPGISPNMDASKRPSGIQQLHPWLYDVETLAGLTRSLVLLATTNATLQANTRMLAASSTALQANNTVRAVAQCPPWNVTAAEWRVFLYNSVQDFVTPARRSSSLIMSQKGSKMYACPFDEILKTEHHIHT